MRNSSGVALLAVLWLAAALSAIALTVANTVRAETDRTATDRDSLQAYYLAVGAIDRTILYTQWGTTQKDANGKSKYFQNPTPVLQFDFPTGVVTVEVIPETAKFKVNTAKPDDLRNLLFALGVDSNRAETIVAGILDWRSGTPGGSFTAFDQYYLSLTPSFRSRHASFQEIEELLLVRGVTPDLFYGSYTRDDQGRLVPHAGLRDCLSVYGAVTTLDVNGVQPEVMRAIGIPPDAAAAIVAKRKIDPIRTQEQLGAVRAISPAAARLAIAPLDVMTLRATARLKLSNGQLSDLRRSAAAMVKFFSSTPPGPFDAPVVRKKPFEVLRWYDNAYSVQ